MLREHKIGLIGAGNIAEALVSGMLKSGVATPGQILATDIRTERLKTIERRFKVRVGEDNQEVVNWASIIILAIKPQVFDEVMAKLKFSDRQPQLMITVIAGLPISRMVSSLPSSVHVVRAMPNTPSIVLEGATGLAAGPGVSPEDMQAAQHIFESVGKVVQVSEPLMDTITGLSGGGPAYVYVMIEALADGGVKMGLSRDDAQLLAAQTVLGAAKMVLESGEHPGVLKDRVASPGGTTIAGLHRLEEGRVRSSLIRAVESATKRSQELGGRNTSKT